MELRTMDVLGIAARNASKGVMVSSAKLALKDAIELFTKTDFIGARNRALKSLSYSVGVFHADYQTVEASNIAFNIAEAESKLRRDRKAAGFKS